VHFSSLTRQVGFRNCIRSLNVRCGFSIPKR
jgi:hypothetical protein